MAAHPMCPNITLDGVKFDSYNGRYILPNAKNGTQVKITINNGCKFYITQGQSGFGSSATKYTNADANRNGIMSYLTPAQTLNGSGFDTWREVVAK